MNRSLLSRVASCMLCAVLAVSSAGLLTSCGGAGGGAASSMTQSQKEEQQLRETITSTVKSLSDRMEELKISSVYLDDQQLKLVVVANEISDQLKSEVTQYIDEGFVVFKTTEENKPSLNS